MGRRESTLLMFWGASTFWAGLLAALVVGVWIGYDLVSQHAELPATSLAVRFAVADRLLLIAACHMVSLLGGITYRLSQAS